MRVEIGDLERGRCIFSFVLFNNKRGLNGYLGLVLINYKVLLDDVLADFCIRRLVFYRTKLEIGYYVLSFLMRCKVNEFEVEWFIRDLCYIMKEFE